MKLKKVVKLPTTDTGMSDDDMHNIVGKARKKRKRRTTSRSKTMPSYKFKSEKMGMLQSATALGVRKAAAAPLGMPPQPPVPEGGAVDGLFPPEAGYPALSGVNPTPGAGAPELGAIPEQLNSGNTAGGPSTLGALGSALGSGIADTATQGGMGQSLAAGLPGVLQGELPPELLKQVLGLTGQMAGNTGGGPGAGGEVDPSWMEELMKGYGSMPAWARYGIPLAGAGALGAGAGYMMSGNDEEEEDKYAALKEGFDMSGALKPQTGQAAWNSVSSSHMSPSASATTSTKPTPGVSPVKPIKVAGLSPYCRGFLRTCIDKGLDQKGTVDAIIKAAEVDENAAREWMSFIAENL